MNSMPRHTQFENNKKEQYTSYEVPVLFLRSNVLVYGS